MSKKTMVLFITMCILLLMCVGCGSKKEECEEVLLEFESSCNALDISGILNCIDPKVSDPLKTAMLIGNAVVGDDIDGYLVELLDSVAGGLTESVDENASASEMFEKIDIEPDKYKLKSKKGTVDCITTFNLNGVEIKKTVRFTMVKKNDSWYISGLSIVEE